MADLSISSDIFKDAFTVDLTAGAVNHTTAFGTDFRLGAIYVNRVGAGGNQNFMIYRDASEGVLYDTLLDSQSISNDSEFVYIPPYDLYFKSGDEVRVEFPSLGGSGRDIYISIIGVQE
jgi:hypothetical protein